MNIKFSNDEAKVIECVIAQGIKNGNSANPNAFVPTPEQYKILCNIFNRICDE